MTNQETRQDSLDHEDPETHFNRVIKKGEENVQEKPDEFSPSDAEKLKPIKREKPSAASN